MTLYQRFKRLNFWNKIAFIASILSIISFFGWLASLSPIFEKAKSLPHFTFKLLMDDSALSNRIELTNDFLVYDDFGKIRPVSGFLFVPIQFGESNVQFDFFLKNNSELAAENIEVAIFIPKTADCIPDPAWSKVAPDWIFSDTEKIGAIETNEMESFGYYVPNGLLSKNGIELPPVKLSPFQVPLSLPQRPQAIIIEARGKDWSNTALAFSICFLPSSIFKTNDFYKPFVLSKTELKMLKLSPETLEKLQR